MGLVPGVLTEQRADENDRARPAGDSTVSLFRRRSRNKSKFPKASCMSSSMGGKSWRTAATQAMCRLCPKALTRLEIPLQVEPALEGFL